MTEKPKGPDPNMNNPAEAGTKPRSGGLDRQIQAKIGQQLRAMYDEVVDQGVPDRFAELLKKLDGAQSTPKSEEDSRK
jgi:O-acetyl-ADP-ribose deacetylase (regulator of RNase III)